MVQTIGKIVIVVKWSLQVKIHNGNNSACSGDRVYNVAFVLFLPITKVHTHSFSFYEGCTELMSGALEELVYPCS